VPTPHPEQITVCPSIRRASRGMGLPLSTSTSAPHCSGRMRRSHRYCDCRDRQCTDPLQWRRSPGEEDRPSLGVVPPEVFACGCIQAREHAADTKGANLPFRDRRRAARTWSEPDHRRADHSLGCVLILPQDFSRCCIQTGYNLVPSLPREDVELVAHQGWRCRAVGHRDVSSQRCLLAWQPLPVRETQLLTERCDIVRREGTPRHPITYPEFRLPCL